MIKNHDINKVEIGNKSFNIGQKIVCTTQTKNRESGYANKLTFKYSDGNSSDFFVYNGAKGDKGDRGVKGDRGCTGPKGDKGLPGKDGCPGYTPKKGIDYFDGEKGDKGDPGEKGDKILMQFSQDDILYHENPEDGDKYMRFKYESDNKWGDGILIRGPQGPRGPLGNKGDAYTITLKDYSDIAVITKSMMPKTEFEYIDETKTLKISFT